MGSEAVVALTQLPEVDVVVNALVGAAGLEASYTTLKAGKVLALANKESLVVGGEVVMRLAAEKRAPILPVDSEHSAIFQCLAGESSRPRRLIVTCSGGSFRDLPGLFPAYHMNRENWITAALDGSAEDEIIKTLLDLSYHATASKIRSKPGICKNKPSY